MRYFTGALAILPRLVVVVFSIQNRESVSLVFLVWSLNVPKIFLILGIYVLGMLSGWGLVALVKRLF
jgi:uncharacterized integral membrane protein